VDAISVTMKHWRSQCTPKKLKAKHFFLWNASTMVMLYQLPLSTDTVSALQENQRQYRLFFGVRPLCGCYTSFYVALTQSAHSKKIKSKTHFILHLK
jgi:hypothetical protein